MKGVVIALSALVALGCSCEDERPEFAGGETHAHATPEGDGPEFQPIAGGVGWTAEEPFVWARPSNDMRDAQYTVRGVPNVELTVSHFAPDVGGGGDVDANVERWAGQFDPQEGREVRHREINDLRVTTVDVGGTFVGRQGMGPAGAPRPSWRMLGAIVEGPEGLVFFKLLGPASAVETSAEAFEALVATIHPE
ncbi:MAG: hypothetical protein KC619_09090 [Myxococcales bacterium]|nr:hypothetical protein [Myxococcales bacterium]